MSGGLRLQYRAHRPCRLSKLALGVMVYWFAELKAIVLPYATRLCGAIQANKLFRLYKEGVHM